MKVSVLMPTYNDEKYIRRAVESVLNQREVDVELIIVNDGSTDNTEDVILSIKDERIKYIKQENRGQLDAILNGSKFITGDLVCLFHSDDLIVDEYAFKRNATFIMQNKLDGVYSDYIKIDSNDRVVGKLRVIKPFNEKVLEKLFQARGGNVVGDHFFVQREAFFRTIVRNYVIWNEPYWFTLKDDKIQVLRLGYIPFSWYKYRVYSENYVRSEIGKFVATNGVVRTIVDLSKYYKLYFPNFRFVHRLPTKLVVRRRKEVVDSLSYHKDIMKLIMRVLLKDYKVDVEENIYYRALLSFYSQHSGSILELEDRIVEEAPLFVGKDVNVFYKMLVSKNLPNLYQTLLEAATRGSFIVRVGKKYERKIRTILKFLNFDTLVYAV